ncbi:MAG: OsmC family protein [Anaerolineaceae bacterium]|nr:OsmC family protein [Anaerolineaceae bacterium]
MDAKVTWKTGLSFTGETGSGFQIPLGTAVDHGGDGSAPGPMEVVLVALGGCTAMDVISILEKKQQKVSGFEIKVHGDRAEAHPKVYTDITLEYIVTGTNLDPEAVKRAVELSETKYCSVNAMLKKTANVTTKVTLKEA